MPVHHIDLPDFLYGREPRLIIWDDEAGTVTGTHSSIPLIAKLISSPTPVEIIEVSGNWTFQNPAHDPSEFLAVLYFSYNNITDEPLRSSLPAVFDGVDLPICESGEELILPGMDNVD